ncbi:MAG TPA: class E sortase [Candidatus Saccharimonadales bacterium]
MKLSLSRINTGLLAAIILINGYVIVLPIVPQIALLLHNRDKRYIQHLETKINTPSPKIQNAPADDRLIIPSMGLDQPINQGRTAQTLQKGLWLRPNGSTPDKGSNTVIVGHRFTYSNPKGILYSLNAVQLHDHIGVWWKNKHYVYSVGEIKEVSPDQTSIEAPTADARLTIYTCTPLWMPKNRLVVIANLEKIE